ncbi:MAG: hypothetical protein JXA99_17100 [Candidatus Lokiarchaeota archaeon]|nr:hypothetical protein [Candidatus Lokiarchaeota archaeon]
MNDIGGFFELELNQGLEYHNNALRLNLGHTAFEYILRLRKPKRIFLPYYTCDVMLYPLKKLSIPYNFYHIDKKLEPIFDYKRLKRNEYFVYTNYFGIKDCYIKKISMECNNLIIDNAQAFFSFAVKGVDTFYSARKFFGVPDGAYLYTSSMLKEKFKQDNSANRFRHLIGRVENSPENAYSLFKKNEQSLYRQSIKTMSNITRRILKNIDYERAKNIRLENFNYLEKALKKSNLLNIKLDKNSVPMVYPYFTKKKDLRNRLIKNRIFVAQYWPNVYEWVSKNCYEYYLTNNLIPLPIDQRYSVDDMKNILEILDLSIEISL